MKIENVPFGVTDWPVLPAVEAPGVSGTARASTVETGDLRLRQVVFSAGYRADHWCRRGHVVLVLAGLLKIELDGRSLLRRRERTELSRG